MEFWHDPSEHHRLPMNAVAHKLGDQDVKWRSKQGIYGVGYRSDGETCNTFIRWDG